MSNKQIFELQAAQALVPEDQVLISQAAGNLTRRASLASLPVRVDDAAGHARTLAAKLGELVSVKDFGAEGDGVTDDSAAFQAALDRHQRVFVPPGTYRLSMEIQIRPRRHLVGAGRDATIIDARAARAFTFQRNLAPFAVETGASSDWNRASLSGMTIRMSQGGVRVNGHEFRATDLAFFGGSAPAGIDDADGWCLDLVNANECTLFLIQGGYGAIAGQTLTANGIRFRSTDAGVNYGDSMLGEISLKLAAANLCGVQLVGSHPGLINNVLMERVQVNAPAASGSPGAVAVPGTAIFTFAGTVGVHLKTVRRTQLDTVDVEVVETAFKEEGTGLNTNPGTNTDIVYINCQAQNCVTAYDDNNDDGEGRTMRRTMIGTTEVFPLKTGIGSTDDTVQAGRGATLLPSDLWLCEPTKGAPAVQLRAYAKGVLYLAQDYQETAGAVRDGNVKNQKPRRGLILDASANDTTVIAAPRGLTTSTTRRIEIGNGPDHPDGRLHRIELRDPLYLTPRSDVPANATKPGMVVYFDSSAGLPVNTRWQGPGLYILQSWQGGFEWMPAAGIMGLEPDREENGDVTLSQFHVGRMVRVNSGSTRTVNIPEGIVSAAFPLARVWIMRQGSGRVLFQETGTPAPAWRTTTGAGVLKEIPRQYQIVEMWLRWNTTLNSNAGGTEIFATHDIMPDGEFLYSSRLHWTNAQVSGVNSTAAAPYAVAATHLGRIIRVANAAASFLSVGTGLVPGGQEAAWFKVMKAAAGDVNIQVATGMTAIFPGGATSYVLTQVRKIVTVHITSSTQGNEPNTVYIEE